MKKDQIPVIAFDVDGVIRVPEVAKENNEVEKHVITIHKDQYPDVFHSKPTWEEDGTITTTEYYSKPAVELLQELAENDQVELVWATTWQKYANTYFSKLLEIPELPVAVKTLGHNDEQKYKNSSAWKGAQLSHQFDHRPLLWVDDNLPFTTTETLKRERLPEDRATTHFIQPDFFTGLTQREADLIREWVQKVVKNEQN